MENEIKVGEYIRTKDGKIIKFNKFGTLRVGCINPKYYKTIISNRRHYKYDDIVKHSPNLIDIIEKRRLCKWNISNRKRKHIIMDRNKRNR